MKRTVLFATLVMAASLFGAAADDATPTSSAPSPKWKIAADLEEACSCRAACPCWFKSKPSRMTCDGVQAVFIKKGHFGKTSLDGLAVAQWVQSPEGKSMFESFGSWNFDYVYIDERANEQQREALKAISGHLFPAAAKKREFRFVPITRTMQGDDHNITVGTQGSFAGHLVPGGYGSSPKVSNPPLADPTHKSFRQGEATSLSYHDAGQNWDYHNSNYMRNEFKVNDKEYAKFEAEMARKMAEAQK